MGLRNTIFGKLKVKVFKSVFNTTKTKAGSSDTLSIRINFLSTTAIVVDWGDGNSEYIAPSTNVIKTHIYSISGVYNVTVKGNSFTFLLTNDSNKIIEIKNWGGYFIRNSSFANAVNLTLNNVEGKPTISSDFLNAFNGTTSLTTIKGIETWDSIYNVDCRNTFLNSGFNGNVNFIKGLYIGNTMFQGAVNFNSSVNHFSPISGVTNFFNGARDFNQPLNLWNTSAFTSLHATFASTRNFNQGISMWNMANILSLYNTFAFASAFNTSVNAWNLIKCNQLFGVFQGSAYNLPLNLWNTSKVTDMGYLFAYGSQFNQDISMWDVSKVVNMDTMFRNNTVFNQDISNWNFNIEVNFSSFMLGKSSLNYDPIYYSNLLIKLASIMVGSGRVKAKVLNMGTIQYTSTGITARADLVADGWSITDGGLI